MTPQKADDLSTDPILTGVPEVNGYKLLEPCVLYARIGQGGMGAVYRGTHLRFNLDVGVKCLHPNLAAAHGHLVVRFEREAKLAAMLNHPNLVRVFDVDERHGVHYLVMEFVRGETARERVMRKGKGLRVGEAAIVALGAARGLAAAHASGVVHRDLKPDNILISKTGEVKVADLGLGRLAEDEDQTGMLTQTGLRMGTPRYMPPEQWDGLAHVGAPGDVWALGATIYFLLAGRDSYGSDSRVEIMKKICLEPFPDIRRRREDVPESFVQVIEKCTRIEPGERYPDAGALAADLEKMIHEEGLSGVLQDPESGVGTTRCELVSPPPPELLAKMRMTLTGDGGLAPTVVSVDPPSADASPSQPTQSDSTAARVPKRRPLEIRAIGIVALIALLALGSIALQRFFEEDSSATDGEVVTRTEPRTEGVGGAPLRTDLVGGAAPAPAGVEEEEGPDPPAANPGPPRLTVDQLERWLEVSGLPGAGAVHTEANLDVRVTLRQRPEDLHRVRIGDLELERRDGWFEGRVPGLVEGLNRLSLTATAHDEDGPTTTTELVVRVDMSAPQLGEIRFRDLHGRTRAPDAIPQENWLRTGELRLTGSVSDTTGVQLEILLNNAPADADPPLTGSSWVARIQLPEGLHTVTVRAVDDVGREVERSFYVGHDSRTPEIEVREPRRAAFETEDDELRLTLVCSDPVGSLDRVMLNGEPIDPFLSRDFPLELGPNHFRIEAYDLAGRTASEELVVTRTQPAPVVVAGSPLGSEPDDDRRPPPVEPERGSGPLFPVDYSLDDPPAPIEGFDFVGWNEATGLAEFVHQQSGILMVLLPGGTFEMGARDRDPKAASKEKPRHAVELDPFLIAKFETTQEEWSRHFPNKSVFLGPRRPVENVHWVACVEYADEFGLVLPTEAQWEYACRGKGEGIYGEGDLLLAHDANFGRAIGETELVGRHPPNGFGLHDMAGNVHELCRDNFDADFYGSSAATEPNPLCTVRNSANRLYRGGAWSSPATSCRASARWRIKEDSRSEHVGFRLAFELPPDDSVRSH